MQSILLVGVGSVLGALARFFLGLAIDTALVDTVKLIIDRRLQAVPALQDGRSIGAVTQEGVLRHQLGRRPGGAS